MNIWPKWLHDYDLYTFNLVEMKLVYNGRSFVEYVDSVNQYKHHACNVAYYIDQVACFVALLLSWKHLFFLLFDFYFNRAQNFCKNII